MTQIFRIFSITWGRSGRSPDRARWWGGLLASLGDYEGARPYYERTLAILTARLGDDHPHTRIVGNNLAA